MDATRDIIAAWISKEIIPHECILRNWLTRRWSHVVEVEDVIQESYCRISYLTRITHIENARSYLFRTAHNVVTDQMRRSGIINFMSLTQIDWEHVIDCEPLADRSLEASQELNRVQFLLSKLSFNHRRAIELRRIEGLSRQETAEELGVTTDALKKHIERGIIQIIKAMNEQDTQMLDHKIVGAEQKVEVLEKRRSN